MWKYGKHMENIWKAYGKNMGKHESGEHHTWEAASSSLKSTYVRRTSLCQVMVIQAVFLGSRGLTADPQYTLRHTQLGYTFIIYISFWWFQTMNFIFHFIHGMSSFPLTNSIIFQRGRYTTNQLYLVIHKSMARRKMERLEEKMPRSCLLQQSPCFFMK